MAIKIVLILGTLMLGTCSTGLLIVRIANPRLKGLGWLGAAFATSCTGTALIYFGSLEPLYLSVVLADVLMLASLVLVHLGVLELAGTPWNPPVHGLVLVALQMLADTYVISGSQRSENVHLSVAGLLVAAQVGATVYVLARKTPSSIRVPAKLTAVVLACFMAVNIFRGAAAAFGFLNENGRYLHVQLVTFTAYLISALSIGFGFFWMTTSLLTSELDLLASTDPLTRIFNRRVFLLWCEKEVERSRRTSLPFSMLMIDLDHFKQLNDEYGHQTGDAALCAVVESMQDSIRGLDVLGRWGGEEFVALLPAASPESALLVAQRMRRNIAKIRLPDSNKAGADALMEVKVTASIGVSTYRGPDDALRHIIQRADAALYEAKASGRNQVLSVP
jgi:diguanylate cyclase (GGDEF)-like protein